MGLSEDEFIATNSSPGHAWNECLRRLERDHGIGNRLYLYSEGAARRVVERDGLEWVLVPAPWHGVGSRLALARRPDYQFSLPYLRELRVDPPDLFVFYGNLPTPFARRVARHLVARSIPYVATIHSQVADLLPRTAFGAHPRGLAARLISRLRAGETPFLLGHAGAVLVLTPSDRALAVEASLARPERIHVLPSGVTPRDFHPGEPAAKAPYPRLCFVGRLEEAKGFLEAVQCLAAVCARFPSAELHVAGAWTSEGYRRSVEDSIAKHHLAGRVRFHGWLGPAALGDLYRSSHVLVFPSRKEGLSRAILEAMTCGTPAVARTDAGGPSSIIRSGATGILAEPDAFTTQVLRLLEDRDALEAMSHAAASEAGRDHSLETMVRRVEQVYLPLIRGAASR
jgi:glycosyltransferase involved in cell wall biosynthesis